MHKPPKYLRLVHNSASPAENPVQISTNTAGQNELVQIEESFRIQPQIVMQMPADFDCRNYILGAPANLGMDSVSQFEHPDDNTPYLRLIKKLATLETAESRYAGLAVIITQIRQGLKDFYGEKALSFSIQDSSWNLRLPFGLRDNRTFEHTQTITSSIRNNGMKINSATTHFEITDQQMILCLKHKNPSDLIKLTRENLQYFPFLLEDLKEVLI